MKKLNSNQIKMIVVWSICFPLFALAVGLMLARGSDGAYKASAAGIIFIALMFFHDYVALWKVKDGNKNS